MNDTFEVIRTDAETGKGEVVSLEFALARLAEWYRDPDLTLQELTYGSTLRTPFAYYKRRGQREG